MNNHLYPVLILAIGSLICTFIKGPKGKFLNACFVLSSLFAFSQIPLGFSFSIDFNGLNINLIKVDKIASLIIYVFHIVGLLGIIYNWTGKNKLENISSGLYLASAVGLVLAGDLFSLFIFWELLTIFATVLILSNNTFNSQKSALRYFLFHIFGGLIFLLGIVLHFLKFNSLELTALSLDSLSNWLIFIGVGVNCAFPLLHIWVTYSYPESTPTGAIYLSSLTTKTACLILIRLFAGETVLIWIGSIMMIFPVFFAVIENNLRRVLSFSLINQVGLIITAIGIGSELAINGAVAHIVTDIFFKGLLFMSVGAVLYRTGKQNATELGGLYRYMPITTFFCIIGALSISAFPLFSGFVSKSMIVSASASEHLTFLWFVLLFASAAVLEHAGIKVPFFTFFGHNSDLKTKEAPKGMLIAMGISAAICIGIGIFPQVLLNHLPYTLDYNPYTLNHIITQLQLLIFAGLAFFLMLLAGIYPPEKRGINLDVDYFYRKFSLFIYRICDLFFNTLNDKTNKIFHLAFIPKLLSLIQNYPQSLTSHFVKEPENCKLHKTVHLGLLPSAIGVLFALIIFIVLSI